MTKDMKNPTYRVWQGMKQRCDCLTNARYKDYGGRGITYDPRWKDFDLFLQDMGEKPKGLSLDRKKNDEGYCKENCRWATAKEQQRNTRRSALNIDIVLTARSMCSLYPHLSTREVSRIVGREFAVKAETVRDALKGRVWT